MILRAPGDFQEHETVQTQKEKERTPIYGVIHTMTSWHKSNNRNPVYFTICIFSNLGMVLCESKNWAQEVDGLYMGCVLASGFACPSQFLMYMYI